VTKREYVDRIYRGLFVYTSLKMPIKETLNISHLKFVGKYAGLFVGLFYRSLL